MIQVELDPATKHLDPDFERKVRECKLACKEAAGWRCEYVYPNGKRCRAVEGQLKRKKGRNGRPDGWSVTHVHGCHLDQDRLNPRPRLVCLCARHHFELDRNLELKNQMKMYRRGYQLTSTDALLEHLLFTGISITEASDGYHWSVDGTELQGHRTTAIHAVGAAIYQLRNLQAQTQAELLAAHEAIQHLENQLAAGQERENTPCRQSNTTTPPASADTCSAASPNRQQAGASSASYERASPRGTSTSSPTLN